MANAVTLHINGTTIKYHVIHPNLIKFDECDPLLVQFTSLSSFNFTKSISTRKMSPIHYNTLTMPAITAQDSDQAVAKRNDVHTATNQNLPLQSSSHSSWTCSIPSTIRSDNSSSSTTSNTTFKSSGIIPWCIHNGEKKFLFQRISNNENIKGWLDFGGKCDKNEDILKTAAREFSEETSGMFYLFSKDFQIMYPDANPKYIYHKYLANHKSLNKKRQLKLLKLINESTEYFYDKLLLNKLVYSYSSVRYICYYVQVEYIQPSKLLESEDIHVYYKHRYIRQSKWFTIKEIKDSHKHDFHKRLQFTNMHTIFSNNRITDLLENKNAK